MDFELSSLEHADSVLPMNSLTDAIQLQTKLVDEMTKHFTGDQFLSLGDLGVVPGKNRPKHTILVEQTLASFFQTEEAALVRGSGTGAITTLLSAILSPGEKMFIHDAPVYSTTKHTISSLGLETVIADYNDELVMKEKLLQHKDCKVFYIQHARQQPTDTYQLKQVIQFVKKVRPDITIVSDDNYCVFKTDGIAVEHGADYSTFSGFKVLGPEGVGVIVGKKKALTLIHERNYSGGSKVQGFEAMELLRMMTFAPVMFAIQNKQVEEICKR